MMKFVYAGLLYWFLCKRAAIERLRYPCSPLFKFTPQGHPPRRTPCPASANTSAQKIVERITLIEDMLCPISPCTFPLQGQAKNSVNAVQFCKTRTKKNSLP
jgi:hypothetical protein